MNLIKKAIPAGQYRPADLATYIVIVALISWAVVSLGVFTITHAVVFVVGVVAGWVYRSTERDLK